MTRTASLERAYEAGRAVGETWPRVRAMSAYDAAALGVALTADVLDAYTRGFRAARVGSPVLVSCILRPAYRIGVVARNRSRRQIVAIAYRTNGSGARLLPRA